MARWGEMAHTREVRRRPTASEGSRSSRGIDGSDADAPRWHVAASAAASAVSQCSAGCTECGSR